MASEDFVHGRQVEDHGEEGSGPRAQVALASGQADLAGFLRCVDHLVDAVVLEDEVPHQVVCVADALLTEEATGTLGKRTKFLNYQKGSWTGLSDFSLVQHSKMVNINTKRQHSIPNDYKIYPMDIQYTKWL
jgi:hypothetical protein